jgi:hypothetical protein
MIRRCSKTFDVVRKALACVRSLVHSVDVLSSRWMTGVQYMVATSIGRQSLYTRRKAAVPRINWKSLPHDISYTPALSGGNADLYGPRCDARHGKARATRNFVDRFQNAVNVCFCKVSVRFTVDTTRRKRHGNFDVSVFCSAEKNATCEELRC